MVWFFVGILLLGIVIAACYCCYRIAFYSNVKDTELFLRLPGEQYEKAAPLLQEYADFVQNLPCEKVFIQSYDGLKLAARYYHNTDHGPLEILFHGYRSWAPRDFAGGVKLALSRGHNVLLVDQRAHGDSEGRTITFGVKEQYDCLAWIDYAVSRFGIETKIILYGISMGAATVLMASAQKISLNVVGIIADCPYASAGGMVNKICGDIRFPGWAVYPFVALGGLLFGKFCVWRGNAVKAAGKCRIPVLLIHGEMDNFIPKQMSHRIYMANPAMITMKIYPGGGHAVSYATDPEAYCVDTDQFVAQCLKRPV